MKTSLNIQCKLYFQAYFLFQGFSDILTRKLIMNNFLVLTRLGCFYLLRWCLPLLVRLLIVFGSSTIML